MSHFCCIEFSIHFSGIFRFFLSYHLIKILCVTQEYQHFMPKAVSVFAGRRCMSVMLFDRTTNKLCLCLSATRRYFAARRKRVYYSWYIQGEMQLETIFICKRILNIHDLDIISREMLNTCILITMNELYPENGITRFLNLIQMQQGMKNSRWSKSDKIFSYFLFPLSL